MHIFRIAHVGSLIYLHSPGLKSVTNVHACDAHADGAVRGSRRCTSFELARAVSARRQSARHLLDEEAVAVACSTSGAVRAHARFAVCAV
eukprot:6176239-Pleurochrysis_carterae.AAC.3